MNLPFYIPDYELSFRIAKLLSLFQTLSKQSKKSVRLDLAKIAQFEFLTRHPIILNRILNDRELKVIQLQKAEMYSIEALFLNQAEVFDFKKIKALIKILLANNYLKAEVADNFQVYYTITTDGIEEADNLQSQYFMRLRDLNQELRPLVNLSSLSIGKLIQSHITYGKEN